MSDPVVDALSGDAPQLGQSATEFDTNTNVFVAALYTLQSQLNTMIS